jgi:hypothetical protein
MSAYCAHLGADLAEGKVLGNAVQCAFHFWEFNADGRCQKVGCGDPAPKSACLFVFPSEERYGVVWAFNGQEPLFPLPSFPERNVTLYCTAEEYPGAERSTDPWVNCAQTPDIQHIIQLHQVKILGEHPADNVEWTKHSMFFEFKGAKNGRIMDVRAGIVGTSVFVESGTLDGRWFGMMSGYALPQPGRSLPFAIFAVETTGDERGDQEFLSSVREFQFSVAAEDQAVVKTIHFRAGALTKSDATLARFLTYLREFPRAHPSAAFIN